MASEERLRELEEKYEDYKVYDNRGDKIGKVDDLFVDETDREEYIGVKLGLLGRKSTLIPMEIVRVNEADRTIEVSESKDHVKDAPSFDDDEDITAESPGTRTATTPKTTRARPARRSASPLRKAPPWTRGTRTNGRARPS